MGNLKHNAIVPRELAYTHPHLPLWQLYWCKTVYRPIYPCEASNQRSCRVDNANRSWDL